MNRTLYQIIQYIIEKGNKTIDFSSLAGIFNVSERMIRNYIDEINSFLINKGIFDILVVNNSTITINSEKEKIQSVVNTLKELDFYDYKLSAEERKSLIIYYILFSDKHIKPSELEKILKISRTSIQNSILTIKNEKMCNLELLNDKTEGYYFAGSEKNKRELAFLVLKNLGIISTYSNKSYISYPYTERICKNLELDINYKTCKNAILDSEKKYNITMTERDFLELSLLICICIYRNKQGCIIEESVENGFEINSLSSNFSNNLLTLISKNIKYFNSNDINYITSKLNEFNYLNSAFADKNLVPFYISIKSFIHDLSSEYSIDLSNNDTLIKNLTAHIYDITHGSGITYDTNSKTITDRLIKKYNKDFFIIKKHIYILEEGLNYKFNDNDIALILIHVLSAIERTTPNAYKPNVIIVCNSGVGTSNFLAVTISNNLNVNVVAVTSAHNLDTILKNYNCDLIISTIFINVIDKDVIKVDPVISEDDLANIKDKLNTITRNKLNSGVTPAKFNFYDSLNNDSTNRDIASFISINKLIKEKFVILDKNVKDWKEAIKVAAKPLVDSNLINNDYVDNIIGALITHGPYMAFKKGIVFAHAPIDDNQKDALSILRLNNPVNFNSKKNDPIKFIFVFSSSTNNNRLTVLNIMNMLFDEQTMNMLSNCKNSKEVITTLANYEKNLINK